jgi:NADH:ubiquinone oxidoreductase subunit 5 (subunit L)/multisubunit Na+/H+ antiporter MnhA subunit
VSTQIELPSPLVYLVPFLLLLSAIGKSAQFPYSSWLPRAMEGPTSSSAIFYGGLSIHAGVYLLLRVRLEYQVPTGVLVLMAFIGAISCLYGAMLTQVQSDVKSALAYASLSQVGTMFVEISLGWYYIATIHCLGHAFLRTYQILKCSSIIHQFVEFKDSHQHDIAAAKARFLLGLAAAVIVGLFPFHGWVLPFLGAPRSSVFLPMLCVETGLLFFFRLLAPMLIEHSFAREVLMPFPVVGLLYASLLFFSEQRLKRIPACLYLSHVSLMALGALGLGHLGIAASMLDGIDRHKFLVSAIAVALTLNGFTSFRLFAKVFYGQPFSSRDPASALLLRERLMMLVIVALIVVNGVAPAFLVRTLTALSS